MFGSKKFQKGMEAGARPFEAKFAQYDEVLKHMEQNFGKLWKENKDVADEILNHVEEIERVRIYGLYPQIDIKELKPDYKKFLIAMLYALSSDSANDFQQSYIRSVQKYLEITTPQTSIDFVDLEKIDSLNAQKAIFQACVEYLLLGNGRPDFFEQYKESLFSHFAGTEKAKLEIWKNVLQIYTAIGPLGLAEKYGFVPKAATPVVEPEDLVIDIISHIPAKVERPVTLVKEKTTAGTVIKFGACLLGGAFLGATGYHFYQTKRGPNAKLGGHKLTYLN